MHGLPRPAQHSSNQSLQARWWSYGSEAFSVAPARLTQEGRITTREQLRAGVQELATALIVRGVQRSDRLGLVIPPGSAMATALPPCEVNVVPIQGPNVTAGYEATGHAAAPSGWITAANGESWFLTAHEGYLDPQACLFLSGRNKKMINRGGDKVIPSRVDEALLEHPAVEQALAFAMPHPTLGEDLAAAVVLRPGAQADERALCRHVSTLLAPYEVPSRILFVQELPRTATGTLERIGIAAMFGALLQPEEEGAQGEMEELVAQTFAAVLQLSPPARHANFFLMGGDSLSGTRVVNRLSEQLFLEVPTTLLFEYPTVSSVAEQLHKLLDQALEEAEQSTS